MKDKFLIFILLALVLAQSESSQSPVFKGKVLFYLPEIQKEYSLVSEISPQKQQKAVLNVEEQQMKENSQSHSQAVPQLKNQSQVSAIPIKNLENLNANRQQQKRLAQSNKITEQKPAQSSDQQKTNVVDKKQLMFEQIYHIPLKKDKIYTVPQIQERSVLGNEVKLTQQQKRELQNPQNPQKQAQQRRIKQEQLAKIKAREQQKIKLEEQQKNMQIQALKQKQLQILKLKQLQLQKQKQQVQKQKKQLQQLQERRKKQEELRKEQQKKREEEQQIQRQRNRQEKQKNRQAQKLIKEKIQVTDIDISKESEQKQSQNEEFQRSNKQQGRQQTDRPQRQQNIIKQPIIKEPAIKKPEQPTIQLKLKPKSNLKTQDNQTSSHIGKIFPIMVFAALAIFIYGYVSKKQEQKKRKAYNPTSDDEQATFR